MVGDVICMIFWMDAVRFMSTIKEAIVYYDIYIYGVFLNYFNFKLIFVRFMLT